MDVDRLGYTPLTRARTTLAMHDVTPRPNREGSDGH